VLYERAYYHCVSCHSGEFPTDSEFGIERKQTRGACELIALAGNLEPFAEGGGLLLPRMAGLYTSASVVQRTTEAVGADVAKRRAAGEVFGEAATWNWHTDAANHKVAYVTLDATAVLQQGPGAARAEPRMPWVAAVYNPNPAGHSRRDRRLREIRYISGLMSLPEVSRQLRRECQAAGLDKADLVIAITDGGNGLENCLQDTVAGLSRQTVFILDFFHVVEHLREFANSWLGSHSTPCKKQVRKWKKILKSRGGEALLNQLAALDLTEATPSVRESHRELLGYLRNNLHRTDYPTYIKNGWQIGSGVVESACKSVVGRRLKQSGMRWTATQTTPMCQLRSLYRSSPGLWADYWKRPTSQNHLRI
jgi:hypothetical protein